MKIINLRCITKWYLQGWGSGFCQIRIRGSVPRTNGDLWNLIECIFQINLRSFFLFSCFWCQMSSIRKPARIRQNSDKIMIRIKGSTAYRGRLTPKKGKQKRRLSMLPKILIIKYFKYHPSFEVQSPESEFGQQTDPQHFVIILKEIKKLQYNILSCPARWDRQAIRAVLPLADPSPSTYLFMVIERKIYFVINRTLSLQSISSRCFASLLLTNWTFAWFIVSVNVSLTWDINWSSYIPTKY